MTFRYSRHGLLGRERQLQRLLEILPGALSWTLLLGMAALSWWAPVVAAAGVIAFECYWLLRLLYMTIFLGLASLRLSAERDTDWMARLRGLKERPAVPRWDEIHHLVIIPIATEGREIVEPGVRGLAQQTFPAGRILLVLAVEARARAAAREAAEGIRRACRGEFLDCLVVVHPDGLPGEARVKGANASYAARAAARELETRGVPFDHVVASCFDADTVVSPHYMACLTYHYLTTPDRARASFQPIPVYHNNIWEVPGFARVLDIGSSFMQLIEATNPEKLVTFSSHSMSFTALVDVGYWPVDMISDDSAIFWKAFIHYEGRYRVVPMYITLSMDVAAAGSRWATAAAIYRQKRRWAWGVENLPIVLRAFLTSRRIPWHVRVRHAVKMLENHLMWATGAFFISIIGWLPAVSSSREFSNSVLYYSAPRIQGVICQLASLSLLGTILLSLALLPPKTTRHPLWQRVRHALEWLFVPVIFTFLSALPALDAQTRLMLGRYMEFRVTEKRRVS